MKPFVLIFGVSFSSLFEPPSYCIFFPFLDVSCTMMFILRTTSRNFCCSSVL